MAHPNRTVAAFNRRKWMLRIEEILNTRLAAVEWVTANKQEGERGRISSFKIGPRAAPIVKFAARIYVKR